MLIPALSGGRFVVDNMGSQEEVGNGGSPTDSHF